MERSYTARVQNRLPVKYVIKKGDGMGKLGKALKPNPCNFTCSDTLKDVSAGQMF